MLVVISFDIEIIILIVIQILLLFLIIFAILRILKIGKYKKMYNNVANIFKANITNKKGYSLSGKIYNTGYDFVLECPDKKIYIKVIPNFNCYEININNATKWNVKKSYDDTSLTYVEGVDDFIRLNVEDKKKASYKLFIVYPDSKTILKYVNECELQFVDYGTDVYGCHVVPYVYLKDNFNDIIFKFEDNDESDDTYLEGIFALDKEDKKTTRQKKSK